MDMENIESLERSDGENVFCLHLLDRYQGIEGQDNRSLHIPNLPTP